MTKKSGLSGTKNITTKLKDIIQNVDSINDSNVLYRFDKSQSLIDLITLLNNNNINIENFVVNYDNEIIGINIKDVLNGFIPCEPGFLYNSNDNYIFMNDIEKYSLEDTIAFLQYINEKTNTR